MSAVDILRDALFGNPPSPTKEPSREGTLAAFTELYQQAVVAQAAAIAGITILPTTADRDTFYTTEANRAKLVYVNNNNGSATDPANGIYEYVGGPRIAQSFYDGLALVVQPLVDRATAAATGNFAGVATLPGFIDNNGGDSNTSDLWRHSPFIRVLAGDRINWSARSGAGSNVFSYYSSADQGSYISGTPASGSGQLSGTEIVAADSYMRISYAVAGPASFRLVPNVTLRNLDSYAGNFAELAMSPGFVNNDGTITNLSTDWANTGFLQVAPGYTVDYDVTGVSAMNVVSYYTARDTSAFISGVPGPSSGSSAVGSSAAPANAKFAIFSWAVDASAKKPVVKYRAPTDGSTLRQRLAVVGVGGDSRISTNYPAASGSIASLIGCSIVNTAVPGATAAQSAFDSRIQQIFDANVDLYVEMIGGNDTGAAGSVGTFSSTSPNGVGGEPVVAPTDITKDYGASGGATFVQAIDHKMRKIKAHDENVRQRAGVLDTDSEATKLAKMAAVKVPLVLWCTDLPQKRDATAAGSQAAADAFSSPVSWERKRQAIIEAASRNGVIIADTMTLGWLMALEPFANSSDTMNVLRGNATYEGVHYVPWAWQYKIAPAIIRSLGTGG